MVHAQETMYFGFRVCVGCNVCMIYIINENNVCDNCNKLTKKELPPIFKICICKLQLK